MSRPPPPSGPQWEAAPNGLDRREVMTLLFTDLVGSTRLKEDLGNVEALRLIHEHHSMVRSLLGEYREGFEISTAGDSFFLAFRKPSDAVSFALRLQNRLQRWNRRQNHKLRDRIGIHAGEVTVESDAQGRIRDLHGLEVDKCARVMSLGRENHILLTRFAYENARASLKGQRLAEIAEIQWVSHGPYMLKGVLDPVEICEVCEAGWTTLEPPTDSEKARRLDAVSESMPAEPGPSGWRRWLAVPHTGLRSAVMGAGIAAVAGFLVLTVPLFRPITNLSYDLAYLFRSPKPPPDAVIVRMDPQSEEILGQPSNHRWDRRIHAALVRRLAEYGARAVVLDVWFAEPSTAEEDEPLIQAAREFGNVAVAGRLTKDVRHGVFAQDTVHGPFPALAEVTHWGLSHYPVALDQIVRRPYRGTRDREHLAVEAAKMLGLKTSVDPANVWLNYYGPPGTIDSFSYSQVLTNLVPREHFTNRVVFVGAVNLNNPGFTEGWLNDEGATPYTRWTRERSSGVEIVATTSLNLLHGQWLRRLPPWFEAIAIALTGALGGFGLCRLRPMPALVLASAAGVIVALVSITAVWWTHYWIPWLIIAAVQLPLAVAWSTIASADGASHRRRDLRPTRTQTVRAESKVPVTHASRTLSPAPEAVDRAEPFPIAGYSLLREIGQGAYGTVWLARDVLGLFRAIKVVRRSAFEDPRPYEREFGGIQRFTPISLEHEGLVPVLHVGRDDRAGFFYYAMETADDETSGPVIHPDSYRPRTLAADLARRRTLPLEEVIALGIALGNALEFLHQRRLVHRDIKPANVLYIRNKPRLGDIGLVARMVDDDEPISLVGTRGYLAPEGPGTAVADVFSLGRLLYVATTGQTPEQFPEVPSAIERSSPPDALLQLNRIWIRACSPDASKRHASAAELVQELTSIKH